MKWLFLAAALVLWAFAGREADRLAQYECDVQLRSFDSTGTKRTVLASMLGAETGYGEEQMAKVAAWNVERGVTVLNESCYIRKEADCILVWGDKGQILRQLLPGGDFGWQEDEEGCIISRTTAYELFGSTDVTGKWISCKGKKWLIRAVTAGKEPLIVISGERLETEAYQNLSFSYESRDGIRRQTEELVNRYGLSRKVLIDGSLYAGLARLAASLPVWLLFFVILRWMRAFLRKRMAGRARIGNTIVGFVILAISAAGFALIFSQAVRLPEYFIPTRWSDVAFWKRLWQGIMENMISVQQLPKTAWDVRVVLSFERSFWAGMMACFCIFPLLSKENSL